jgi:Tfp pilus assembly protein PilN
MINLLPEETKTEIRAARLNVILMRYIVILGLAIAFLVVVLIGSHFILDGVATSAQSVITSNQNKASSFGSTQAEANQLTANLSSAKTLLDANIDYTKIITEIAGLVPKDVVLDKLSINPAVFGTPSTIQAYATSTQNAIALKDAFAGSILFSNVSLQSLSSTTGVTGYPVSIQLSVTFNKGAAQ